MVKDCLLDVFDASFASGEAKQPLRPLVSTPPSLTDFLGNRFAAYPAFISTTTVSIVILDALFPFGEGHEFRMSFGKGFGGSLHFIRCCG